MTCTGGPELLLQCVVLLHARSVVPLSTQENTCSAAVIMPNQGLAIGELTAPFPSPLDGGPVESRHLGSSNGFSAHTMANTGLQLLITGCFLFPELTQNPLFVGSSDLLLAFHPSLSMLISLNPTPPLKSSSCQPIPSMTVIQMNFFLLCL